MQEEEVDPTEIPKVILSFYTSLILEGKQNMVTSWVCLRKWTVTRIYCCFNTGTMYPDAGYQIKWPLSQHQMMVMALETTDTPIWLFQSWYRYLSFAYWLMPDTDLTAELINCMPHHVEDAEVISLDLKIACLLWKTNEHINILNCYVWLK